MTQPVVVHVLTGFLGSGKTHLLNRLLRDPAFRDTAVLINEFGAVGLDHLLVEASVGEPVLLPSGCICCSIRGDLKAAILRLFERQRAGELPPFGRIVIETTGLADPAPILATFIGDPMLRHCTRAGATVTMVDAINGLENLSRFSVARRQATAADHIVISKTDIAPAAVANQLRTRLAALNPLAGLDVSGVDTPMPSNLFAESRTAAAPTMTIMPSAEPHAGITACVLSRDEPLDWAAFGLWLSMLVNRHGGQLLRLKGLAHVQNCAGPVVIQGVQHVIHPPRHLERWPPGQRQTRLVAIVQGMAPDRLQHSFDVFLSRGSA